MRRAASPCRACPARAGVLTATAMMAFTAMAADARELRASLRPPRVTAATRRPRWASTDRTSARFMVRSAWYSWYP